MTITAPERSRVAALGQTIDPAHRRTARLAGALFTLTFVTAIAWEASLGIYLLVKGFRPSSPILGTRSSA